MPVARLHAECAFAVASSVRPPTRVEGDSLAPMPSFRAIQACVSAALALSAMPFAQAGPGQSVHRCAGRHGEIVFSGTPCSAGAALGARASAVPAMPDARDCPASREELVERVAAAIGRSDVNALAGLLGWGGVGARAADERLRMLHELVSRPLLAIDREGDGDSDAYAYAGRGRDADALHVDRLRVRTGGGDAGGMREHAFGMEVAAGCHWLAW